MPAVVCRSGKPCRTISRRVQVVLQNDALCGNEVHVMTQPPRRRHLLLEMIDYDSLRSRSTPLDSTTYSYSARGPVLLNATLRRCCAGRSARRGPKPPVWLAVLSKSRRCFPQRRWAPLGERISSRYIYIERTAWWLPQGYHKVTTISTIYTSRLPRGCALSMLHITAPQR